jgi:hypothetical protein
VLAKIPLVLFLVPFKAHAVFRQQTVTMIISIRMPCQYICKYTAIHYSVSFRKSCADPCSRFRNTATSAAIPAWSAGSTSGANSGE